MHTGRPFKRKLSSIPVSDERRVRATAFQSLPPSSEELKGILELSFGSVERIFKLTDSQGLLQFQILFTNADSAAKAIEHREFEGKYGPMQRRITCTLSTCTSSRERTSQNLRSPESRTRPRANTIPPGSGALSPTNHSPRSHSHGHPTCQAGTSAEGPCPTPPTPPNNDSTTQKTDLSNIHPNLPTNHIVDTPSARVNTTSFSTLVAKVAHQSTEIICLEGEVSSLKARDLQSEEDKKALEARLKRKVARIRAVTGTVNRMHTERVKLIAKSLMAKRRLKVPGEELKTAREASDQSQEALRTEFDSYKEDQLRIGAQYEREHKEQLQASIANQELLHRVQTALDERSKQVALLQEQRDQDIRSMNEADRNVDMLRTSLSKTERAAATTFERLFAAERALSDKEGEYEKKCAEISAARREIASLRETLTIEEHTHEATVQQLEDLRASEAQLQQDRLIDNQSYEAQLSHEREVFEAALFQAQLQAQEAVRAEATPKGTVFSALEPARREMSDQMAHEGDAFASALSRAKDDVRDVRSFLDIEREHNAFLQEEYKRASKPVIRAHREAQTEPMVAETPTLQNGVQPPYALDSLLQAFVAMRDLGISVIPRATLGATDQH